MTNKAEQPNEADPPIETAHCTTKAAPLPLGDRNRNPADLSLRALIAEDFRTHGRALFSQGFLTLLIHRFGNWRMGVRWKLLRMPLTLIYRFSYKAGQIFLGIDLPYTVRVGRRVCLEHFGGMILIARSIGNDVTIRQNTTFGIKDKSDLNAKPIIEDHVDIGVGAVLIGDIRIGPHAFIGANAVVLKDVPPGNVAVGVPARNFAKTTPPQSPS